MKKSVIRDIEFIVIGLILLLVIPYAIARFGDMAIAAFLGGGLFLIMIFAGPFLCFLPYFATSFFVPVQIFPDKPITYNQVFGVLYLAAFFLWYFKKIPGISKGKLFAVFSAVLIYFCINTGVFGEYPELSIRSGIYLLLYFVIFLTIIVQFRDLKTVEKYFWGILILTALSGTVGLFEFISGIDLFTKTNSTWQGRLRVNGMAPNAIVYGCNLIWAFPMGYFLFCKAKTSKARLLSLSLAFFCLFVSLLTFSRQNYIYIFAAFAILAFFMRNKFSRKMIVLMVIIGILASPMIGQFLIKRFTAGKKSETDPSIAFRTDGTLVTKEVLKIKPLQGVGLGSYPKSFRFYLNEGDPYILHYYKGIERFPDFGYNQLLVEGGLIGFGLTIFLFICILLFLLKEWKTALKKGNQVRSEYIATVLTLMVIFLLQNMIQDTFLYIRTWLMFAFIEVLENRNFLVETPPRSETK